MTEEKIPESYEAIEKLENTEEHDKRFSRLIRKALLNEMIYKGLAGRDDEDSQLRELVDQVEELMKLTYQQGKDVVRAALMLGYDLKEPTDMVFIDMVSGIINGDIFKEQ